MIGGNGFENLDFPITGPKKKVVVNFIYGYQNLAGEKYKSNGKRIRSIRHTSEEKNPKNHRKYHFPEIWHFRMVFWIFLFTGMSVFRVAMVVRVFKVAMVVRVVDNQES